MRMDEDEVVEFVTLGTGEVRTLRVGLDAAEMRARTRYLDGEIEVEEYEAELDRIAAKREGSA